MKGLHPGINCVLHDGASMARTVDRKNMYSHLAEMFAREADQISEKDQFSLREELGITRMLLNRIFHEVGADQNKLMREFPRISDLLTRIEKMVTAAMRAEKYIGGLLSRKQAGQMVQELVNVISEEVKDDITLQRIAERFDAILNKKYADD
jgi:YesN/AraC family two-component response regulator